MIKNDQKREYKPPDILNVPGVFAVVLRYTEETKTMLRSVCLFSRMCVFLKICA